MFSLILLLATAPESPPRKSEARDLIEWQLRAPPRADGEAALSAGEADMIYKRYLQSIGQRLEPAPMPRK